MKITGWGRYPTLDAKTAWFDGAKEAKVAISGLGSPFIAHGLGRSYGDSALSSNVLFTRRNRSFLNFDSESGVLVAESGVSLAEIIEAFLPRGFFLPVTPGTKFVTLGGAIAADVHGKNHHVAGSFSDHVEWFDLLLPSGEVVEKVSATENEELFQATCGGMGLTGIILTVALKLARVNSSNIRQTTFKAKNLTQAHELFESHSGATYSVAWIDCLGRGEELGRSLLMIGENADDGLLKVAKPKKLTTPIDAPGFLLNRFSVKAFNALYYNRIRGFKKESVVSYEPFFYPLDAITDWNRLYGKAGFTQYQFVIPLEAGVTGVRAILEKISQAGLGSFLSVLKQFGAGNENYLSFPMKGYTLAIDFKIEKKLFPLLNELDKIVLDFGGRLYLAKDVRASSEVFSKGYPMLDKFREVRKKYGMNENFSSLQSKRLGI